MADTLPFAFNLSALHMSDLPDSWSAPLKRQYVQQHDFNQDVADELTATRELLYQSRLHTLTQDQQSAQTIQVQQQQGRSLNQVRGRVAQLSVTSRQLVGNVNQLLVDVPALTDTVTQLSAAVAQLTIEVGQLTQQQQQFDERLTALEQAQPASTTTRT